MSYFTKTEEELRERAKSCKTYGEVDGLLCNFYETRKYFRYLPEKQRNDRKMVTEFMKRDGAYLEFCPLFQDNREIVSRAINNNPCAFQFASDRLKTDRKLVVKVLRNGWKNNNNKREIVNKIKSNISEEFINDKEINLICTKIY